jgi:hypothetical protein
MGLFTIRSKTTDLLTLAEWFSQVAPRETQWALARVLSNAAWRTRLAAIDILGEHLKIRNRNFVKASMKFEKADPRQPIDKQFSRAGSVALERATGWVEQQLGGVDDRKRIHAGHGRTRGGSGQAKQKYRFTPDKEVPDNIDGYGSDDYMELAGGDPARATVIMTSILQRRGYIDQPMVIKNAHVNDGVYVLTRGGKLRWVATLDQKHNVRQVPWIDLAWKRAQQEKPLAVEFNKELSKQLERSAARKLKRR